MLSARSNCVDSPLTLGYVSPEASSSPIASRAMYQLSPSWMASGDYVWDPYTRATNNGNLNFHYQPETNHIISFGYTYLVGGICYKLLTKPLQTNPLHQATVAYAWPFNDHWSSGGLYYNVSESYSMMSFCRLAI